MLSIWTSLGFCCVVKSYYGKDGVAPFHTLFPHVRNFYLYYQAFMERLGLWGEGAPYRNFEQFLVSIQKKGLGKHA